MSQSRDRSGTDEVTNKVVLIGDEGVGKTAMFQRFKYNDFVEQTSHTRYEAEHRREWDLDGKTVEVCLVANISMA